MSRRMNGSLIKPPFPCTPSPQAHIFTDWLRSHSVEIPPPKSLGLNHYKDGNVGVAVFPEGEEIFVCILRFGGVARDGVGTGKLKTGERAEQEILHDSGMIGELLELRSRSDAVPLGEICQAANVRG